MTAATPARPSKPRSTPGFLLRLAVIAWVLRCLVVEPFFIPSGSMLPTMAIGDYLFVAKWPYGYSRFSLIGQFPSFAGRFFAQLPERGDIIVFKPPGHDDETYVKRAIGLPGDTVEMRNGVLILNGRAVPKIAIGEARLRISPNSPCHMAGGLLPRIAPGADGAQSCRYTAFQETLPGGRGYTVLDHYDSPIADHFGPVTVPAGTLFMMGDNRDDSEDSRFPVAVSGIGFVPLDRLVGRASMIFWSTDGSVDYARPSTWFSALRGSRMGQAYR